MPVIDLSNALVCPSCKGVGLLTWGLEWWKAVRCPHCRGTGVVTILPPIRRAEAAGVTVKRVE